jgi:hypothetical protein
MESLPSIAIIFNVHVEANFAALFSEMIRHLKLQDQMWCWRWRSDDVWFKRLSVLLFVNVVVKRSIYHSRESSRSNKLWRLYTDHDLVPSETKANDGGVQDLHLPIAASVCRIMYPVLIQIVWIRSGTCVCVYCSRYWIHPSLPWINWCATLRFTSLLSILYIDQQVQQLVFWARA